MYKLPLKFPPASELLPLHRSLYIETPGSIRPALVLYFKCLGHWYFCNSFLRSCLCLHRQSLQQNCRKSNPCNTCENLPLFFIFPVLRFLIIYLPSLLSLYCTIIYRHTILMFLSDISKNSYYLQPYKYTF